MKMRSICYVLCLVLLGLLSESDVSASVRVRSDSRDLRRVRSTLLYRGVPFTGQAVQLREGGTSIRTSFRSGREHGWAHAFYPNGHLRFEKYYEAGLREGQHRGYWPSGRLQFDYRYHRDLFEGEQLAFFENGTRAERRSFQHGHEEGLQRFWNSEGRLIANYTFKQGKRYGIVGRFDCMSVVGP